jgi:hypothetical protein
MKSIQTVIFRYKMSKNVTWGWDQKSTIKVSHIIWINPHATFPKDQLKTYFELVYYFRFIETVSIFLEILVLKRHY